MRFWGHPGTSRLGAVDLRAWQDARQRGSKSAPESAPDLGAVLGAQPFINDFHSKWGAPGWRTSFFNKKL